MFQLLAYRELIKQDRERIDKGGFQGRASWSFSVVSKEVIATWLLFYQRQSMQVPGLCLPYLRINVLAHLNTSAFLPFSSPQDDCVSPFLSLHSLSPSPHFPPRACITPASGYAFPSSSGSASLITFSFRMGTMSLLSFILLPFSFTDLFEHFGLKLRRLRYSQ